MKTSLNICVTVGQKAISKALIIVMVGFAFLPFVRAADVAYHLDPAKVVGADACNDCHAPAVEAWKLTHHYLTFNTMHHSEDGQAIAHKLGIRRIKDESLCLKCHYTEKVNDEGKAVAISGVSCESCHGAASDWIKVHSATNEINHLANAAKLGMAQPDDYYHIAANCFSCHTVPEENLVNTGGHKAGSDFELVSWLSGEVRHNFLKSAGKVNAPVAMPRQRMLYIVGRALDLEFSLRGMAKASAEGDYSKAMLARVKNAEDHLTEIVKASDLSEVKQMLAAVNPADLKPGNADPITKAADAISKLSISLSQTQDGSKLASVDSLIPGPDKYKGTVYTPQ
jgi:hypothetical protein